MRICTASFRSCTCEIPVLCVMMYKECKENVRNVHRLVERPPFAEPTFVWNLEDETGKQKKQKRVLYSKTLERKEALWNGICSL